MGYWLLKSEPDVFGIDHLKDRPDQTEPWDGVRNYHARNMLVRVPGNFIHVVTGTEPEFLESQTQAVCPCPAKPCADDFQHCFPLRVGT